MTASSKGARRFAPSAMLHYRTCRLRARAEINSHFAAGPQARWRGASDELYPVWYVRSEQQNQRACGRSPKGRGGGRASALLPLLDDVRHRLRRGASHLPARRSRQNVNLFLREPLDKYMNTVWEFRIRNP